MYIQELFLRDVLFRCTLCRCTIHSQSIRNHKKRNHQKSSNSSYSCNRAGKLYFAKMRWAKFASHVIRSFLLAILTSVHSWHMTYTAIVGLSEFTLQEFSINSNRGNEWESGGGRTFAIRFLPWHVSCNNSFMTSLTLFLLNGFQDFVYCCR